MTDNDNYTGLRLAPRWSDLSRIGESTIARSAYFWLAVVPLAAIAFSKVERIAHVEMFNHKWQITLELPFSWKMLFWASLAASIANLIYQFRCPRIIRRFPTFKAFVDDSNSGRLLTEELLESLTYHREPRQPHHWKILIEFIRAIAS
jgi:hypothetical protein